MAKSNDPVAAYRIWSYTPPIHWNWPYGIMEQCRDKWGIVKVPASAQREDLYNSREVAIWEQTVLTAMLRH